jgi:hypothetical protein
MTDEQTNPAGGGYFARYKQKLTPLIGADAAAAAVSYYRWALGLAGFAVLAVGLAAFARLGTDIPIWLCAGASLLAMAGCGVMLVVVSNRGGKLAAAHLSKQFGRPVRNHGLKVSYRWWQEFVAGEGTTRRDEMWRPRK